MAPTRAMTPVATGATFCRLRQRRVLGNQRSPHQGGQRVPSESIARRRRPYDSRNALQRDHGIGVEPLCIKGRLSRLQLDPDDRDRLY